MKQIHELIRVYSAGTLIEAEMVKAFLNSQDIPVFMKSESFGRLSGLMSGPLSEVVLLVPAEKAAEASELIAQSEKKSSSTKPGRHS
jgi:Putative prokaryotic signal transducing protein